MAFVVAILAFRLVSLAAYPLMDTSEARYGEIARVMVETGDWITPQETPGTPFWAKPPLSTWLSAASAAALGPSEFALRLPSLACALAVLALCAAWARTQAGACGASGAGSAGLAAWLSLALLATATGFFVAAGAVMTDPSLVVCTTAMLAAFHRAAVRGAASPWWRYGFFLAAGLGMLAKGPVILLYVGAPVFVWTIWQRRVAAVWHALPWAGGTVLAALICVPWYVVAEQHTPGFLRYFLVGEHFMRFLKPGWGGDLYGTAHAEPLGTIWLYLAGAAGPGLLVLVLALAGAALARARGSESSMDDSGPGRRFLLLAAGVPVVCFTFAGNIIWTYVLPALPPLAVLAGDLLAPRFERSPGWRRAVFAALAASGLFAALAFTVFVPRHVRSHSSADLVAEWRRQGGPASGELRYLGRKAPASLRFYARGAVRLAPDVAQALAGLEPGGQRYLALSPGNDADARRAIGALPIAASVESLGADKDLELLRVRRAAPAAGSVHD